MIAPLRIGSLFSGYAGLDLAVQSVLNAETVWFSEFDAAPSKILAHHWPTVPNHGDITKIDWSTVGPVDILTGGFPCPDVSLAGARTGFTATSRSGLWSEFARAIAALNPRMVLIENVQGLLSAAAVGSMEPDPWGLGDGATRSVVNAFGVVLGDLAGLGYDAEWCGVRAADAGAPHPRHRVFILAYPQGEPWRFGDGNDLQARRGTVGRVQDTGASADAYPANLGHERAGSARDWRDGLTNDSDVTADASGVGSERRQRQPERTPTVAVDPATDWGPYEPAIRRWEAVMGRCAPEPTEANRKGGQRLSPRFVEFLMGLDEGHVTDPAIGLTRNEQLKALGNGVVPQQAALALSILLPRMTQAVAA